MLRLVVLACVLVAAYSLPTKKSYELFRQTQYRRFVYEQNMEFVKNHNSDPKHTYKLGDNEYADMLPEEFVYFMNGYVQPAQRKPAPQYQVKGVKIDNTVDWRNKGYVTGVKNQKQCGSCWAFSATGSLEGQHYRYTRNLTSLSEQNLMDCSRPQGNMGCQGGLMDQAFEYIKINDGVDTEMSYPYTAMNGQCEFMAENVGATDIGYMDIPTGDEQALMEAVATEGPISVAIDASRQSFQLYESGVYSDPMCSSTKLDHGVLVVGYGTENGQDYWLVKNSWGKTWGMKGYIKMARNMNNMCGIATSASYPLVNPQK